MEKTLAVFDFDGTLTHKDSMLEFTRFYHGFFRYFIGMLYLSPMLIFYKAGIIPNWRAKEYYLTHFFGKTAMTKFQEACDRFAIEKIPDLLRPSGKSQFEKHQKNGDQLVIVSASAENWLSAWCKQKNISLIATRLKTENGLISGKLDGENCYGAEKVNRLKKLFELNKFSEIIVYGDSKGDFELFDIATRYYYKPFR